MIGRFRPAETARTIFEIDYDRLHAEHRRVLLFDLDNTLGRRRPDRLSRPVDGLLGGLSERGFRIGILTNRRRPAGDPVIEALEERYEVVHTAKKPSRRGYLALLDRLGATPDDAVMIGDRWVTDVFGANRLGIHSIRVQHPGAEHADR